MPTADKALVAITPSFAQEGGQPLALASFYNPGQYDPGMAQTGTPFETWLYYKATNGVAYNGQTEPTTGETQIYCRPEYPIGVNPFSVGTDTFSISTGGMPQNIPGDDTGAISGGRAYTGGMLSTRNGFADNGYGYWETSVKITQADGRWITFWLLPVNKTADNSGQKVEIDVLELLDNRRASATDLIYNVSIHGGTKTDPHDTGIAANVHVSSDTFHTYGILRTPDFTRVYLDGVQLGADFAQTYPYDTSDPHYAILSVATGGKYGANLNQPPLNPLITKTDFKYLRHWPLKTG